MHTSSESTRHSTHQDHSRVKVRREQKRNASVVTVSIVRILLVTVKTDVVIRVNGFTAVHVHSMDAVACVEQIHRERASQQTLPIGGFAD